MCLSLLPLLYPSRLVPTLLGRFKVLLLKPIQDVLSTPLYCSVWTLKRGTPVRRPENCGDVDGQ